MMWIDVMPGCLRALFAAASLFAAAFAPLAASAEEVPGADGDAVISVNTNMARVLRIGEPAATVIIGNPGIADVTIQDATTLVITGKAYGQTNLIILDAAGEPIADTMVAVTQREAQTVTVFKGESRTSLSCEPTCQPTIMVGDDTGFTGQVIASSDMVESAAD